ncbi:MAG: xanthine dehydrogenase molybdopterin binding subunit, partial [Candidatus Puniceispirillum sp.]|nr:xanthine dehydrogenase molybdopterin binding subunit [Candidatus Puniceispirillum sp.]
MTRFDDKRTKTTIHKAVRHDSAHKHVSGCAHYTDDLPVPQGTLEVLIAQSPHAHARIISMDLSAVASAAGVVTVMSAQNVPGVNDCSPVAGDDPIFADDVVSYVGQSVFAVAAVDMASARAAIDLAKIKYEVLPAILTIDEAMQ